MKKALENYVNKIQLQLDDLRKERREKYVAELDPKNWTQEFFESWEALDARIYALAQVKTELNHILKYHAE